MRSAAVRLASDDVPEHDRVQTVSCKLRPCLPANRVFRRSPYDIKTNVIPITVNGSNRSLNVTIVRIVRDEIRVLVRMQRAHLRHLLLTY